LDFRVFFFDVISWIVTLNRIVKGVDDKHDGLLEETAFVGFIQFAVFVGQVGDISLQVFEHFVGNSVKFFKTDFGQNDIQISQE